MTKPKCTINTTSPFNLSSSSPPFPFHLTLKRLHPSILTKPSLKILSSQQSQSSDQPFSLISIIRTIPDWADSVKENRMKQNRPLYNHDDWVEHRSSTRHIRHLLSSLSSRVILSLVPPVFVLTTVAAFVASYNTAVSMHLLPEFLPVLRASSLPYQLTAPALALLLVFRTEASYSRLEEGRKAWIKVIVGTNHFARQVMASCSSDSLMKKTLLEYIIAYPVALKCHLIHGSNIEKDLQGILEVDDLDVVLKSNHSPRCIIEFISQSIQLLNVEDSKRNLLESNMSYLHEGIGVCEQLIGIPIPLSYTRLTSRFLVLWHLTLPIILWDDCNWIVVPATFISAASLFCIEEVGVLIEEPFPMLALDELCKKARQSIQEAVSSEKLVQARLRAKRKEEQSSEQTSSNGWPNS
ncbi:UPF0187 protein At3g61320, chloroplastic-like [Impatiens glandulifera]|uniref:UPF0187 protein At3g61320, chloroplastic-like n=1 Tax=Impatiens glandulifera TaxID=253017 RepID=UPI001FB0CAB2|nr:UPF0187 protein At3g61320, chloroplastic-like [Impatiens glandulifera]